VCLSLPECRSARGLRYPCGFIVVCLLLCQCAGRGDQRSMAIWIKENWKMLTKLWRKMKGHKICGKGSVSQSCISRFLTLFDETSLAKLMTAAELSVFSSEWRSFVKAQRAQQVRRRKSRLKKRRHKFIPAKKLMPQYCLDGKSRKGCLSPETGRTEIDLTLFCPDTFQILALRTLQDKEGEQTAAVDIIANEGSMLPKGIFTGDAGITCPNVVAAVVDNGHHYILGIKGNAGKAFHAIKGYDWDGIEETDLFFNEGHGREEIRSLKSLPVIAFNSNELSKYKDIAIVFSVTADVHHVKENKYTTETRYFIGNSSMDKLSAHQAITYIRDHWAQESYHWVKDVVLGEDRCPHKTNKGSRTLGILRAATAKIGKTLFGSVKTFTDHFSARPEKFIK
jgi:Transposase DDE domain